jgi:hypothetical protein
MPPRPARAWRLAASLAALLSLPACIVFVSTAPGGVGHANIVFIAVTSEGGLVARLHVTVVSTDGGWRQEGATAADGAFRVAVDPGVTRLRASVTMPPGYTAAEPDGWPRELDVRQGDLEVRVLVKPD